jgi:L-fuculose-phosphate aldolase
MAATGTQTAFDAAARSALCDAAREVATSGLVVGSAGNVSLRRGDRVLITPGGGRLEALEPDGCVDIALDDGSVADDHTATTKPSSESPLHRMVYAATDAHAIVHTHSHYATVLSTLVTEIPAVHYVVNQFGGPVRVARYECFGTDELAQSVSAALEGRKAALMQNHGAIATGKDLAQAVLNAIQLEGFASVYYHARLAGDPSILTAEQLDTVAQRARAIRYGGQEAPR